MGATHKYLPLVFRGPPDANAKWAVLKWIIKSQGANPPQQYLLCGAEFIIWCLMPMGSSIFYERGAWVLIHAFHPPQNDLVGGWIYIILRARLLSFSRWGGHLTFASGGWWYYANHLISGGRPPSNTCLTVLSSSLGTPKNGECRQDEAIFCNSRICLHSCMFPPPHKMTSYQIQSGGRLDKY